MRKHLLPALALISLFPIARISAQSVISARSGLVNFFEGVAFLDGQPLARKSGTFTRLRDGSTLATEFGRAEVLLTPDTFLRIGENSSIRMISDSIADTQVELLSGSSIVDSANAPAGAFVKIVFKNTTIRILKQGHYRVDAEPAQFRVYAGEAEITRNGKPVKLETSQLFPLDGAPVVRRFTQGSDGLLDLWSEERGELISSKMVSSQTISDPLLDNGPGVPADLASYIGYLPVASAAAYGYSGYGSPYGIGYGLPLSTYAGLSVRAFAPFPSASFLYAPRRYTPVFASRQAIVNGFGFSQPRTGGIGFAPPRSIYVPSPTYASRPGAALPPRVGGTIGLRHAMGHR